MPDKLRALFSAIVDDDRTRVKGLLREDDSLATRVFEGEAWLEYKIVHYVYARDTALHVAAAGYRVEIARVLVAAGADPNSAENHRRSRPLHYAADGYLASPLWDEKRQVSMIRLLLEAGAEVDAPDKNGATALHRAVRTRCASAVNCLLDAGADPQARNKPGSTPFHLAVQNTGRGGSGTPQAKAAQEAILHSFLDRDVRPTIKDANGKSVLAWAKAAWIQEVLRGKRA